MTSTRALHYALAIISKIPFEIIAPQHGSVINDRQTLRHVFRLLWSLDDVGIDAIRDADYNLDFNNIAERLGSR